MQQLEDIIQDAIAVANDHGEIQPDRSHYYDDGQVSILHAIYGDLVVAVKVGDNWQTVLHIEKGNLIVFQKVVNTQANMPWVYHLSNTHLGVERQTRVGRVNLAWKLAYEYWLLQRQIESLLCLAVMMDALMVDYSTATKGYFVNQISYPYGENLLSAYKRTLQYICGIGGEDHVSPS